MRTLTAYGIGVVIVLAVLNGIAWQAGSPRLHGLNVFSAGFALGVLGTYLTDSPAFASPSIPRTIRSRIHSRRSQPP